MILNVCEQSGTLSVIFFVKTAIEIICIIIPLILVISLAIELFKIVMGKVEDMKKHVNAIVRKAAGASAIFFVPLIVGLVISFASGSNYQDSDCWQNANMEKIAEYKEVEKAKEKIEQEKKDQEKKDADEARKKREKAKEEVRKANEEKAEEARKRKEKEEEKKEQGQQGSSTPGNEQAGVYGSVEFKNGVFYIPNRRATSDADTPRQSGEHGLNPIFWERLNKLLTDAKSHGYNVTITSALRTYSEQVRTWNNSSRPCSTRSKWVACPGGSRHGFGIAADLSFNGTSCSGGWDCNAAAKWIHDNAGNYGLKFRMSWEPWHIEPDKVEGGNFGSCNASC